MSEEELKMGVTSGNPVSSQKRILARQYRQNPTPKESEVWKWLLNRGMMNLKWRRQQIIEGFIADFYCAEHRIVLEIDGGVHNSESAEGYDAERDIVFARKGIQTIRISNSTCTKENLEALIHNTLTKQ